MNIFALLFALNVSAQTPTERMTLSDFYEHQKQNAEFDKERREGVNEVKRERELWEEKMKHSVQAYKRDKSADSLATDDTGPEFKKDLKERMADLKEQKMTEQRYSFKRKQEEPICKTEKCERMILGIEEQPRVPMDKRKFGDSPGKGSTASAKPGGGFSSGFDNLAPPPQVPSFNNNNNDFFEAEPPPPAFPPPAFEGSGFDESAAPPPPPSFDGGEF